MQCTSCQFEMIPESNFCSQCGTKVVVSEEIRESQIAERHLQVIYDYEKLTNTNLSNAERIRFIDSSQIGLLSVNDSSRRLEAGKSARRKNSDGTFTLKVVDWVNAMYEIRDPQTKTESRVWITTGGMKYHADRECSGLLGGQKFAQWKGKDTYRPQFVTLKYASWVLGKFPCDVCNPAKPIKY
jgi:hypothetical protein